LPNLGDKQTDTVYKDISESYVDKAYDKEQKNVYYAHYQEYEFDVLEVIAKCGFYHF